MRQRLLPQWLSAQDNLKSVESLFVVLSSKGGVGKTVITASLGLALKERGYKVNLLDLDLTNPNLHLALGVDKLPEFVEDRGIIPPLIEENLRLTSILSFGGDSPFVLRGENITDATIELLTITRLDDTQILVVDTPPGLSDQLLNILRIFPPHTCYLIVAIPSLLALNSVSRLLRVLKANNVIPELMIMNMCPSLKSEQLPFELREVIDKLRHYIKGQVLYLPHVEGDGPQISRTLASYLSSSTELLKTLNLNGGRK